MNNEKYDKEKAFIENAHLQPAYELLKEIYDEISVDDGEMSFELYEKVLKFFGIENNKRLPKCDQCDSATIQGVYCHEKGCPNWNKIYDWEEERWIEEEIESDYDEDYQSSPEDFEEN